MPEPSFSDALDVALATHRRGGSECPVGVALRTLPDADRDRLVAALGSSIESSVITKALRKTLAPAVVVGAQAVGKHRRRECGCA